jgi:hypothetical protein
METSCAFQLCLSLGNGKGCSLHATASIILFISAHLSHYKETDKSFIVYVVTLITLLRVVTSQNKIKLVSIKIFLQSVL